MEEMCQLMATITILLKAVTDCVISLRNGDGQSAFMSAWIHVVMLWLLYFGGFYG